MEENEVTIAHLDRKSSLFRALGHPVRLKIVYILAKGELNVSRITEESEAKISNVSRHLARLKSAGITLSRKKGLTVYYRLNLPFLTQMLTNVRVELGKGDG